MALLSIPACCKLSSSLFSPDWFAVVVLPSPVWTTSTLDPTIAVAWVTVAVKLLPFWSINALAVAESVWEIVALFPSRMLITVAVAPKESVWVTSATLLLPDWSTDASVRSAPPVASNSFVILATLSSPSWLTLAVLLPPSPVCSMPALFLLPIWMISALYALSPEPAPWEAVAELPPPVWLIVATASSALTPCAVLMASKIAADSGKSLVFILTSSCGCCYLSGYFFN